MMPEEWDAVLAKRISRACDEAEHPRGMSPHDGKVHLDASVVRRLLSAALRERESAKEVADLAMLVARLARALDKPNGNTLLATQAKDYLRRHGLNGSPLRAERESAKEVERLRWKWRQYVKSCDDVGLPGALSYDQWISAIDAALATEKNESGQGEQT